MCLSQKPLFASPGEGVLNSTAALSTDVNVIVLLNGARDVSISFAARRSQQIILVVCAARCHDKSPKRAKLPQSVYASQQFTSTENKAVNRLE